MQINRTTFKTKQTQKKKKNKKKGKKKNDYKQDTLLIIPHLTVFWLLEQV